jgi:hypothetical protein
MTIENLFLQSATKRLSDYKGLCDKTFTQLIDDDFHFIPVEECNSISVIITHMHGNMVSRWTDFLTTDGEKEWRQRDVEFEEQPITKDDLLNLWDKGWDCVFAALRSLTEGDLQKIIYIRSEPLTVVDAINRQLAHYSYHVGQIIYAARIIKNNTWQSLSIPKGQSATFNNPKRLS